MGARRINKVRRPLAVYSLVKHAMKEGIFDVELVDRSGMGGGDAKNNVNGGGFNSRAEGFNIVDAWLLRIPANNPSCLVTSKRTIGMEFMLEDPLPSDYVGTFCFEFVALFSIDITLKEAQKNRSSE